MLWCCCDPCPECSGSTCCGGEYPRTIGVCCENVWRLPTDAGKCCDGVWHTSDEPGDCCGGVWYPTPSGVEPPPNVFTYPFTPVSWETEHCPEGSIYARRGDFGQCCGCIPDVVRDERENDGTGGFVSTVSVLAEVCCDPCEPELYLPYNSYGQNIGCLGTCCADDECSRIPGWQCNSEDHPTRPGLPSGAYSFRAGGPCCGEGTCFTECCKDGEIVEKATFEVTGTVEGENQWTLQIGEDSVTAAANEDGVTTLDDIADTLADRIEYLLFGVLAIASGTTITVFAVGASSGTITPPGGEPTGPTTTASKITFAKCAEISGTPAPGGTCPCQTGERCCETATSSGLGLTFHKPGTLSGTVRVTVTGTTNSPILIHGTLFGADATPSRRCPFTHTFVLCHGSFNIEPVPCGATFHNLEVETCYEEEETVAEPFTFSGCNSITVWLGSCPDSCITTMTYVGAGHTSNASIVLHGDAVIEASGTGPLVLTSNITHANTSCPASGPRVLTLAGTNTDANAITGDIQDVAEGFSPIPLRVEKDGPGTWWFSNGDNSFSGGFALLEGTAVIAARVNENFGPLGLGEIVLGGTAAGDESRFLLTLDPAPSVFGLENVIVSRNIRVAPGPGPRVLIGAVPGTPLEAPELPPGFYAGDLLLERDVTLVAPTDGSVAFEVFWRGASFDDAATANVRIGHPDFLGTVTFGSDQQITSGTVSVEYGTLVLLEFAALSAGLVRIDGGAEMMQDSTTPLASPLAFAGSGGAISGSGAVSLSDLDLSGDGHEIAAAVSLDAAATITGDGDALISGVISGAADLTMDGSGTLTLSGSNTYGGTTTINSGTMKAGSLTAFGTGGIVVNAGGTLDKGGFALANTITNNGGTVIP